MTLDIYGRFLWAC